MNTKRDNMSLGCAGLAAGTNAGTFKTSNLLHFLVQGLAYTKAATDNVAFAPFPNRTPAVPALALVASQVACLFISVRASDGAVFYELSKSQTNNSGAGYVGGAFEWPAETPGFAIIGAIKIATNAAGAFTSGTTSLGAANQTVSYYNAAFDYGVSIPY